MFSSIKDEYFSHLDDGIKTIVIVDDELGIVKHSFKITSYKSAYANNIYGLYDFYISKKLNPIPNIVNYFKSAGIYYLHFQYLAEAYLIMKSIIPCLKRQALNAKLNIKDK